MNGQTTIQDTEHWKEFNEYSNYLISDLGNIKRKSREYKNKFIHIKGPVNNTGYKYIQMLNGGKEHRKNLLIHRLVAEAFIPNPCEFPCVDHIDNNRLNNNVSNLRWCSHADNCKNLPQRVSGKKNGVSFDESKQRWTARAREHGKQKFLGYYLTYDEAKQARENWEGNDVFFKNGNDDIFSDKIGKPLQRRQKGTGTITKRKDTGKWVAVLIENKKRVFSVLCDSYEEAEAQLNNYLESKCIST